MTDILKQTIRHITEVAKVPSFSSYEERLHPYLNDIFNKIPAAENINVPGNSLVYHVPGKQAKTIALTAHLDKINHYHPHAPDELPVQTTTAFIEGAMDNSLGMGVLLTMAERTGQHSFPNLLFFFSEMEEKKGLKEHPHLLKNNGTGYESGLGATRISNYCLEHERIPDEVITVDTTPLFKGKPGIALYSKHWELNDLQASKELKHQTNLIRQKFKSIYPDIIFDNNTNDYLHYGKLFNGSGENVVPSGALEPAIYPYHQKGERIFIRDLKNVLTILKKYLG